jgi:hypothetical protein
MFVRPQGMSVLVVEHAEAEEQHEQTVSSPGATIQRRED